MLIQYINLQKIKNNFNKLKQMHIDFGGTSAGAVIKANAYGLGIENIAPALYECGANNLFSFGIYESAKLKNIVPNANVIDLCGPLPGENNEYIDKGVMPSITSLFQLKEWIELENEKRSTHPVWIMFNSGMNRTGINPDEAHMVKDAIVNNKINVFGYMTHLYSSWDTKNPSNKMQKDCFEKILKDLPKRATSITSSDGIYLGKEFQSDITRIGIGLYGLAQTNLENVMKLSSPIIQIQSVKKGDGAGYDKTWIAKKDSIIATVFGGYADGINRMLSNIYSVTVNSQKAPIVGTISMDSFIIDITHINNNHLLKNGDLVDIITSNEDINKISQITHARPHSVLTGLKGRVRQHIIK